MKTVRIRIPYRELEKRRQRWEQALAFQRPDRVPVLHYIGARYWLPLIGFGGKFHEYTGDPRTMLECQLEGQKWILENVKSDFHRIVVYPDFMWVEDVDAFGAETVFPEDDSPWVARPHLLQTDEDLSRLRRVDWVNGGLHGRMIRFYHEMKSIAADYQLEFEDGRRLPASDCVFPGGSGIIGIAGLAGDLCSVEKFSMDMYDKPAWVKELLDIIADKAISWLEAVTRLSGGEAAFCSDVYQKVLHVGDDGTAQMSPDQIQEFMVGPHSRLAEHIRKLGYKVQAHNCGRADHLLQFWAEQVKVDRYIGFSYLTDKEALRRIMGGRIVLMGGIDTVKLHDGSPGDVLADCRRNLEVFRDCPGYVMMDGHNVAPGTPVENLNAMAEAAERYGTF